MKPERVEPGARAEQGRVRQWSNLGEACVTPGQVRLGRVGRCAVWVGAPSNQGEACVTPGPVKLGRVGRCAVWVGAPAGRVMVRGGLWPSVVNLVCAGPCLSLWDRVMCA